MSQQMKTQQQDGAGGAQDHFPKPRTFPTKWASTDSITGQGTAGSGVRTSSKGTQVTPANVDGEADVQTPLNSPMESFPQPRTFPKRWHLTGTE